MEIATAGVTLVAQKNGMASRPLDPEKLAKITDAHVRMSLRLQDQLGLRREEAMKFQPRYADRGHRIVDDRVRLMISRELGHGRPSVVSQYCGQQRRNWP